MQKALLLSNFAYDDRFGWTLPPNLTRSEALEAMRQQQEADAAAASSSSTASNASKKLPSALVQQLGPGYNGTLPVLYVNSAWLCSEPSAQCTAQQTTEGQRACLLQAYTALNPDVVDPSGGGRSYGVSVVLPAVLASVGTWPSRLLARSARHVLNTFDISGRCVEHTV